MQYDISATNKVLEKSEAKLLRYKNVVATGIGYKVSGGVRSEELCIICSVVNKIKVLHLDSDDLIPAEIDGIKTDVEQTGVIRALQSRTGRHRPAPGGVSIGHTNITAGTLGCLVKRSGTLVILSNNHVLADSNAGIIGDAIVQPGPVDGGTRRDHIAKLLDFVPINFDKPPSKCRFARAVIAVFNLGCRIIGSKTRYCIVTSAVADNLVDAAIAKPLEATDIVDNILDVGVIQGVAKAVLDMKVKKSGRTTGLTTDVVLQVNVTVDVNYGAGRIARFKDQFMTGPMSKGGDSGSAVLNDEDELVGLLFAGSTSTTIINHIDHVFSALNVSR